MGRFWWIAGVALGMGCASQPGFPDSLAAAGTGGFGGGGGSGGPGSCVVGEDVPIACHAWAECDPCALDCQCDAECIAGCQRDIYATPASEVLAAPHDRVRECGEAFVACFAEPLGGVAGPGNCGKLQACCVHLGASEDATYCKAVADDHDEAACLLTRYDLVTDGSCAPCDDPSIVAPECEDWALCDPCARDCGCDPDCIERCRGVSLDEFVGERDNLFRCSPAINECFPPPAGAANYCSQLEDCCASAPLLPDDVFLCDSFVDSKADGACFALLTSYVMSGDCAVP